MAKGFKAPGGGGKQPNGSKGLGNGSGSSKGGKWPCGKNGEKGLGKAGGPSTGGYGANQGRGRYNRKRIRSEYGGGK